MTVHHDRELTTKENILNTALDMIKRDGLKSVTLRKIASAANVNLALVNYYFGSKDKLISEALKTLLESMAEAYELLDDLSLAPLARYRRFMLHYASMLQRQPDLLAQMLGKGSIMFDTNYEYIAYLKKLGMHKITAIIQEITGESDPETLVTMMMQVNASCFLPCFLASQRSGRHESLPLPSIEQQVNLLFDHYFHRYAETAGK